MLVVGDMGTDMIMRVDAVVGTNHKKMLMGLTPSASFYDSYSV
jgi:hypothetical protein